MAINFIYLSVWDNLAETLFSVGIQLLRQNCYEKYLYTLKPKNRSHQFTKQTKKKLLKWYSWVSTAVQNIGYAAIYYLAKYVNTFIYLLNKAQKVWMCKMCFVAASCYVMRILPIIYDFDRKYFLKIYFANWQQASIKEILIDIIKGNCLVTFSETLHV